MAQYALLDVLIRISLSELIVTGESDFGGLKTEFEVLGQAADVALVHHDPWIATAIAGALTAVVVDFCICHGRNSIVNCIGRARKSIV